MLGANLNLVSRPLDVPKRFPTNVTKARCIAYFGTDRALASALGTTAIAVSRWKPENNIPPVHALRLRYEIAPHIFPTPPHTLTRDEAVAYFGSVTAVAAALGVSRQNICQWKPTARIPMAQLLRFRYEIAPQMFDE